MTATGTSDGAGGPHPTGGGVVDFDLHGLVRIRLEGAGPGDVALVRRQIGPVEAAVAGEPDITIRFVDDLAVGGPLRIVGLDQAGFTDDAFLILRSQHKARARVRIPLDRIGGRCEIVCERGITGVPQLISIVNLTVLAKGALPLHASAFEHEGVGIAACAWKKGGKTEMLLAFMEHGARYVGDEWVYVSADGTSLAGIPEPVRLTDWHLDQLPDYRRVIRRKERAKLGAIGAAERLHRGIPGALRRRLPGMRGLDRAMAALEGQRHVDPGPERLFGRERWAERTSFDRLLFLVNAETDEVTVEQVDPLDVAARMTFSHVHHRMGLLDLYWQWRFAFPGAANPILEQVEVLERERLTTLLAGKPAWRVDHPHPMAIPALFDAASPVCR
jgi:hypothetical protein